MQQGIYCGQGLIWGSFGKGRGLLPRFLLCCWTEAVFQKLLSTPCLASGTFLFDCLLFQSQQEGTSWKKDNTGLGSISRKWQSVVFAMFCWSEASHRSHPHRVGKNYTRCESQEVRLMETTLESFSCIIKVKRPSHQSGFMVWFFCLHRQVCLIPWWAKVMLFANHYHYSFLIVPLASSWGKNNIVKNSILVQFLWCHRRFHSPSVAQKSNNHLRVNQEENSSHRALIGSG